MSLPTLVIFLVTYGLIGILPKIFFRKDGVYNFLWFVTAAPYFVAAAIMVGNYVGLIGTWVDQTSLMYRVQEAIAAPFALASFGLMCMTLGTHRVPLALWHQDNDAPKSIVTFGAYARVRHPFYVSFLLALIGSVIATPNFGTVGCLIYGLVVMNTTAAKEERKLSHSEFGAEYRAYIERTGRFWPKFWSVKGD